MHMSGPKGHASHRIASYKVRLRFDTYLMAWDEAYHSSNDISVGK